MSIVVTCPACQSSAKVADEAAGRRGKCRRCGSVVQVPVKEEPSGPLVLPDFSALESLEPSVDAASGPQELVYCEVCGVHATPDHMILFNGRVVCHECKKKGAVKSSHSEIAAEIGDVPHYVSVTNMLLVLSIFVGIFLFPIGIPIQMLTMKRLLRLAACEDKWGWLVAAGIPFLGLVAIKLMANRAGKAIHKPAHKIKPLDRVQQERYRQLLTLRRVAGGFSTVPWLLSYLLGSDLIGLLCIPGLIVVAYSTIKLHSFRRIIRQAGGCRILFSNSSDIATDWEQRLGSSTTNW